LSPRNDWIENSEDLKEYQDRYIVLYAIVVLTFVTLFGRLWFLQIVKGAEFKRFSEQNQIKEEKIPAPRGMIMDRNGEILVDSLPSFNVVLTPQYIGSLEKIAQDLSTVLNIKKDEIIDKVRDSRRQNGVFKPVRVKENITRDEVAKVERMKIDNPGLSVEMGIKRNYLLGENGAQLFGYTGEISKEELPVINATRSADNKLKAGDIIGKAGLEKRWDVDVRGADGSRATVVDARGREIPSKEQILGSYQGTSDYIPGKNMTLTIDKDVQTAAYQSMVANKRIGSVVALDPRSGEIYAMVNTPSFDPNSFSSRIPPDVWANLVNDPFKPLRNKAIQDHFPPGSTFKAFVALAALQEKVITPATTFFCAGFLKYGKRPWHCYQKQGHGYMNVYTGLEESCDVYFYNLGIRLGVDRIAKYARLLGLGSRTGIQLDNERSGLIPDTDWKKRTLGEEWQPGENLPVAIGQGFVLLTPLQLAMAYGGIGMDGMVYKPYVLKKVTDVDGTVRMESQPHLLHDATKPENPGDAVITPETFETVKKGLNLVFEGPHGTARHFKIPGLDMAGKTGTVQLFQLSAEKVYQLCENRPFKQRHNGWMVSFAPVDHPRFVVAVHTEHSCHGGAAGPMIHDTMLAYFKKYAPELLPSDPEKLKVKIIPGVEPVVPTEREGERLGSPVPLNDGHGVSRVYESIGR